MTTIDPRVKARIEANISSLISDAQTQIDKCSECGFHSIAKIEDVALSLVSKEAERAAVLANAAKLILLTRTTLDVKADEVKHIVPIDSLAMLSLALDQYLEGK